jgi:hypothetical protein
MGYYDSATAAAGTGSHVRRDGLAMAQHYTGTFDQNRGQAAQFVRRWDPQPQLVAPRGRIEGPHGARVGLPACGHDAAECGFSCAL